LLDGNAFVFLAGHWHRMAAVWGGRFAAIRTRQQLVTLLSAFRTNPGGAFCDLHVANIRQCARQRCAFDFNG
jgi:hypothetical protein